MQLLVLVGNTTDAKRIADALKDLGRVTLQAGELATSSLPDVILTDLPCEEISGLLSTAGGRRRALPAGCGTVAWGDAPWADVVLPADFTDRELRIACQAAMRIAQLRAERDELSRVHQQAALLAETDSLTGLPNRRAWESRLPAMQIRAQSGRELLWLAFVDLDSFKRINDSQGMQHGDRALAAAGQALQGALRRSDLVARLGGDEFGVLLTNIPAERVETVLDRLRSAVARPGQVTASIGYVPICGDLPTADLMTAAERAMRAAKQAGGNRIVRGDC